MEKFEQISIHEGFMKHNGGLMFRKISDQESQFKTEIKKYHLNRAKITHGGFIASIIDAGIGTAVHRTSNNNIFVTISLDIKFIGSTKLGDEIVGNVIIEKVTNSLVFASCKIKIKNKIIALGSGIWKKTNNKF